MRKATLPRPLPWDVVEDDVPILYEQDNTLMGETTIHARSIDDLFYGIEYLVGDRRASEKIRCFRNLNTYYAEEPVQPGTGYKPCFASDVMGIRGGPTEEDLTSYTIGRDGPSPCLLIEVLSEGTAEDNDLGKKVILYARLGVDEYILIDPSGRFLPERLLLKRLQPDGAWLDCRDEDGGVTSKFGFRIIFDKDDMLRLLDAKTGKPILRPREFKGVLRQETKARRAAQQEAREQAEARRLAEEKAREETEARKVEAEARHVAEEKARAESEARVQLEEQLRVLQALLQNRPKD